MTTPERGSVLAHVLIMSAIMTIVAAGMVSMVMMQYRATASVEQQTHAKKLDEIAFARMLSYWNEGGGTPCQSIPADDSGLSYSCTAPSSYCTCTCTPNDASLPVIYVTNTANVCVVNINSAELYQSY